MKDAKEWVMKSIGIYLNQANFDYNELIECYWVVCLISEIVTDFRTVTRLDSIILINNYVNPRPLNIQKRFSFS